MRKFTDAEVREYRKLARTEPITALARRAGVMHGTMKNLVFGSTYAHVDGALMTQDEVGRKSFPEPTLPKNRQARRDLLEGIRHKFWEEEHSIRAIALDEGISPSYVRNILRGEVAADARDLEEYLDDHGAIEVSDMIGLYEGEVSRRQVDEKVKSYRRKEEVWTLRQAGMTGKQIAERVGLKERRVWGIIAEMKEQGVA